jgi:hypothetical protein
MEDKEIEESLAATVTEVEVSTGAVVLVQRRPASHWYMIERRFTPEDPPMREAEAIGGVKQYVPDRENLEWLAKVEALKREEAEVMADFVLAACELRDPPSEECLADLAAWHIEPTPAECLMWNLQDYAVDFAKLRLAARRISRVTEEEVRAALLRFRRELGGGATTDGDGGAEEPVPGEE